MHDWQFTNKSGIRSTPCDMRYHSIACLPIFAAAGNQVCVGTKYCHGDWCFVAWITATTKCYQTSASSLRIMLQASLSPQDLRAPFAPLERLRSLLRVLLAPLLQEEATDETEVWEITASAMIDLELQTQSYSVYAREKEYCVRNKPLSPTPSTCCRCSQWICCSTLFIYISNTM